MTDIAIHTDAIRLDQFLKLSGAVASGGAVKVLLAEQRILRDGVPETARRRKLLPGAVITVDGCGTYRVVRAQ